MRKIITTLAWLFLLFLNFIPLYAQEQDWRQISLKDSRIKKVGFDIGIGAAQMDLTDFNLYLKDANIGEFYNDFSSVSFDVSVILTNNFSAGLELNVGSTFSSSLKNPDSYLTLNNFSFGPIINVPVLHKNRFILNFLAGYRRSDFYFHYNANTKSMANLNTLLSNPNAVRLENEYNTLNMGGRFQYRLGKRLNLKPHEYRIGMDAGYIYGLKAGEWREVGSRNPVPDMPKLKPDNYYVHLTFSGYLDI